MTANGHATAPGALIRADQPWSDEALAGLYDLFPFDGDVPLYLELAAAQGGRVLEVACGSGRVLVPLAQAGNRIVGLDASPHMLAIARKKLATAGPETAARARLVQGDMRAFDLGEAFDFAVIAVKSFAYLIERADQQRTLAAVVAHLRPGGLLALDLMHPSPAWLLEPPGSLRQDLVEHVPERGVTLARTEAVVSTDLGAQVRVIRSGYEIVADDGSVTKRFVEWPYRYTYRFEAEHLLERAGFEIVAEYGGYRREPFTSESRTLLVLARRPEES
ncbi:MAG: class I SAM-dependent methyltransferase [Chloroflexi bacterium]|nr:class I SAM-dependent methyltransferase [Chloroflexota bacterium]